MSDTFVLELDVTAPEGASLSIDGGAAATVDRDVVLTITSPDADTTNVKIYGDVDDAQAPSEYRAAEGDAPWVTFAGTKNIRLSTGDGTKTVRIKLRDDVHNVTAEITDTITLDTTLPVVTGSGPTPAKISKQTGKRTSVYTWQSDTAFEEYKVKVVADANAAHNTGTQIPTTNGSENVSGSAGYPATTNIDTEIDGADLELAGVEGNNQIKIFVREASGNWSI